MKRVAYFLILMLLPGIRPNLDAQDCSSKVLYSKVWVHSHEEDSDALKVYRPSTYKFPPSRGRDSFEIRKNGTIILRTVGRSDRLNDTIARWKKIGKSAFQITFANADVTPTKLEVVFCDDEKLAIKKEMK